ncbi:MAG: MFS transporter [Rhodospirillaceae bacterium]|nr:MFS transporter [Rhodospirillaceae bacterium]
MATTDIITPWRERGPLFVIAGAHGSLHWAMAVFYLLLPFIKTEYGLSYTEIGLLTSVAHISSFATNIPSGMIVDVTGRRMEGQLTALVLGGLAIVAIGCVSGFLALAAAIALISSMNTLWHPAAISYLSASFPNRRGMALAFHTVGASLGDAAAPLAAGVLIAAIGWRDTAMLSGAFPIAAALLMLLVFGRRGPPTPVAGEPTSGVKSYFADLGQLMRKANTWTICIMAGFRSTSQTGIRTFLPLYFYAAFNPDPFMLGVLLMTLQVSTPE